MKTEFANAPLTLKLSVKIFYNIVQNCTKFYTTIQKLHTTSQTKPWQNFIKLYTIVHNFYITLQSCTQLHTTPQNDTRLHKTMNKPYTT